MSIRIRDNFSTLVQRPNFDNERNTLFNLPDAMRSGKTYDIIDFAMRWVITNKNKKWHILTCPLTGIIKEKEALMQKMVSEQSSVIYENDFNKVVKYLRDGYKVVSYITNKKAYTENNLIKILSQINPKDIAIWADEIDTWSVSDASQMEFVKGYKANPEKYKASLYKTMSEISKHTAYCFSFTATESFEFQNKIDTYGDLKYVSIYPMKSGEQKIHAGYVAMYGGTHFFRTRNTIEGSDQTEDTIKLMIKRNLLIQSITKLKRVMMIGCGMDTLNDIGERVQYGPSPNPDSVIDMFIRNNKYLSENFEGCVLTGNYSNTFNKYGKIICNSISEVEVQDRINNLNDPLKLLLVKNMGGRGVTFNPVKDLMLLKGSDASTPFGQSTETPHQFSGRGKSLYVGASQDVFWTKYKHVKNVPGYSQLANTYHLYMPDEQRFRETEKTHRLYDACTPDMLDEEILDICSYCGKILDYNKKGSFEISECEEELIKKIIDKNLGIND